MDTESAKKAAKNETITRSLNEGLAKGEDKWPSEEPTFICECSDLSCAVEIKLSLDVYRAVRAHPSRFFLIPGHMNPEIETKVDDGDGFEVVEKIGPGKEVAERTAS